MTIRDLRITDSTLRDGSHAMRHRCTQEQVRVLDAAGVEVIEISHEDGLGGSSFNYGFSAVDDIELVHAAAQEATQAKIAVLLLPGLGTVTDLRRAHDAGAAVGRNRPMNSTSGRSPGSTAPEATSSSSRSASPARARTAAASEPEGRAADPHDAASSTGAGRCRPCGWGRRWAAAAPG